MSSWKVKKDDMIFGATLGTQNTLFTIVVKNENNTKIYHPKKYVYFFWRGKVK